jgi:hypothetical protein
MTIVQHHNALPQTTPNVFFRFARESEKTIASFEAEKMLMKAIICALYRAVPTPFLDFFRTGFEDPHRPFGEYASGVLGIMFSLSNRLRPGRRHKKGSTRLLDQVDSLIDDLLNDDELSSSSLASILMAARESVRDGYHVALARRTWDASNEFKLRETPDERKPLDADLKD